MDIETLLSISCCASAHASMRKATSISEVFIDRNRHERVRHPTDISGTFKIQICLIFASVILC